MLLLGFGEKEQTRSKFNGPYDIVSKSNYNTYEGVKRPEIQASLKAIYKFELWLCIGNEKDHNQQLTPVELTLHIYTYLIKLLKWAKTLQSSWYSKITSLEMISKFNFIKETREVSEIYVNKWTNKLIIKCHQQYTSLI